MNLQLFAEAAGMDSGEAGVGESASGESKPTENLKEPDDKSKTAAKYTDEDVDKMFDRKFAELMKKHQKEMDEARRLAEMNAQEKAEYENNKLKEQVQELMKKEARSEMSKAARAMLSEKGINANDCLLYTSLSMKNESKLVRYVFDRDKDGLFKKYISETIAYGLVDVCISLTIYLRDLIMNRYILDVMGFLFIYCFILFITSTYRGMSCMLKLIFSDDHKIEKNVSNILSDKEKTDLWSRKGK